MSGRWLSKLQISKGNYSLTYSMMITTSSNLSMLREDLGSKSLDIQTLCMCVLCKQLLIMLQLASIDLDSSLGRNLNIYMVHILLNQDVTSYINMIALMGTGILGGTS